MLFLSLFHKCKNILIKTVYLYILLGYFIDEVSVGLTSKAKHTLIFLIAGKCSLKLDTLFRSMVDYE